MIHARQLGATDWRGAADRLWQAWKWATPAAALLFQPWQENAYRNLEPPPAPAAPPAPTTAVELTDPRAWTPQIVQTLWAQDTARRIQEFFAGLAAAQAAESQRNRNNLMLLLGLGAAGLVVLYLFGKVTRR